MSNEKIDFVITWVDGNDEKWKREKDRHTSDKSMDNRNIRFRDWGILNFWFRAVEQHAPWVNKIHFVTWGHLPSWLNTNHPKINIIKHEDFIPAKYLPTFNSRAIELNLHRIPDLTEKFVYFNDDTFLLKSIKKTDFFQNGLPCDSFNLNAIPPANSTYVSMLFNNMKIINSHFDKQKFIKSNFFKVFNYKYGSRNFRTLLLLLWREFVGIDNPHIATPYLKSTFKHVWDKEQEVLKATSVNRFRTHKDVNPYLFRYWQIVSGQFVPSRKKGKLMVLSNNDFRIYDTIVKQKYKMICINDDIRAENEDIIKKRLHESFISIFSKKSTFEK